jgi:hypothetical protein
MKPLTDEDISRLFDTTKSVEECTRRANLEWEMAHLAWVDADTAGEQAHIRTAQLWDHRAANGGLT